MMTMTGDFTLVSVQGTMRVSKSGVFKTITVNVYENVWCIINLHTHNKIEIYYICASELCCYNLQWGIKKNESYMLSFVVLKMSYMHWHIIISQFRGDEVGQYNVLVTNVFLLMIPTQVEVLCCWTDKAILLIQQRNLTVTDIIQQFYPCFYRLVMPCV